MRVRHLALIFTIGLTLFVLAGSAAACSSSGSTGLPTQSPTGAGSKSAAPASSFGLATNKLCRFSVRYPLGWISAATSAAAGKAGAGPLATDSWADPQGKQVDNHYVDALQVTVYEMNEAVKPSDLVRHAEDFKSIAREMIKNQCGNGARVSVTGDFKPITLNGTKGFQITYTYLVHNTPAGAMSYLLLKGRYAYWITGQASADTWSTAWSKLAPAMASFTIKPV